MRKKLLIYFGCALILAGALAFAKYGLQQLDTLRAQGAASRVIDEQRTRNLKLSHARPVPHAVVIVPPHLGGPVGRLEIPRLHLSVMVLEGTTQQVLQVAAGHVTGTALPGNIGNIGIAAHRDTFFRSLRGVRSADVILLTTPYGVFRYVVDGMEIVDPHDVQVLAPTPDPELTLVTCYPFTYIGRAPKRFIIHARQQESNQSG